MYDKRLKEYNFILLSLNHEKNYKNFYTFFNFSKINEFSKINFFINNKKIFMEYQNYEENQYILNPVFGCNEYLNIFKKKKYNILNNEFDCINDNNILIIKNVEQISYCLLNFLNISLQNLYNNKIFFGGINLILIGNLNYNFFKTNIFKLVLYNNNTFLNNFKIFLIKDNIYLKKYSNIYNNINIYKEINYKFFYNIYNLDIDFYTYTNYLMFFKYFTFITNSENIIQEINEEQYKKQISKKYLIKSKDYIDKDFYLLNKNIQEYYIKSFNQNVYIYKNLKIIFIKNILDINIKKGDIGFIKKIILKKNKYIKYIKVEIKNDLYLIKPYEIILKEKDKIYFSRKQLPFIPAWCVHTKYINNISLDNVVIILSDNLPYYILEKCFKVSKNLYFKNSFYLTNKNYFKDSMVFDKLQKFFL